MWYKNDNDSLSWFTIYFSYLLGIWLQIWSSSIIFLIISPKSALDLLKKEVQKGCVWWLKPNSTNSCESTPLCSHQVCIITSRYLAGAWWHSHSSLASWNHPSATARVHQTQELWKIWFNKSDVVFRDTSNHWWFSILKQTLSLIKLLRKIHSLSTNNLMKH